MVDDSSLAMAIRLTALTRHPYLAHQELPVFDPESKQAQRLNREITRFSERTVLLGPQSQALAIPLPE
jgi:hypothetical protein